jgi:acetyl-CoA acetyltransferase
VSVIDTPEKRSIISGIGISRIGRKTGISGVDLTVEAAQKAVADAGLTIDQIDGMSTMGDTPLPDAAAALGITPSYTGGGFDTGGLLSPVMSAMLAVAEGRARHVLVYRTINMMGGEIIKTSADGSVQGPTPAENQDAQAVRAVMGDMNTLLTYHAYSAVNWLAMHLRRHMHLYGTTKEQLGWLAVNSRRNAALNPLAVLKTPMTLDDYMASRVVSSPLSLYDCDIPVDGSIAVVVSGEAYAADCPRPPIRVEAIGGSSTGGGWVDRPDYPKMASVDAAAEMWSRTDLRPADIDVAQLYDGFTFLTVAWLEALGIVGDGEAGPFFEGGTRIALDGELPLNTYGGQLSAGRMHGYWYLHEACVQLRGEGGERQIPRPPEVAVVAVGGGPIAGCMLLTR